MGIFWNQLTKIKMQFYIDIVESRGKNQQIKKVSNLSVDQKIVSD